MMVYLSTNRIFRWLNSGAFIGYADSILEIMDVLARVPKYLNTSQKIPAQLLHKLITYVTIDILKRWFIEGYPGSDQGFFTQVALNTIITLLTIFVVIASVYMCVRGRLIS